MRKQLFAGALVLIALAAAPTPTLASGGQGMTWGKSEHNSANGADHVGCLGCNPYTGDTSCTEYRPILCSKPDGSPVPPGLTPDFYNGWKQGHIGLTLPVQGSQLTGLAAADRLCRHYFGPGWKIAEFHHSGGGWNWWAYGNIKSDQRFWAYINDQPANCWDP